MISNCNLRHQNCLNILLLFTSATGISLSAFLKRVSGLGGFEVNFALVQLLPLTLALFTLYPSADKPIIKNSQTKISTTRYKIISKIYPVLNGLVVRGVNTITYYEALNNIHSGDVLLISTFISLLGSVCAELLIFQKKPKLCTVISGSVGIIGIAFIARPDFLFGNSSASGNRIWGIFMTLVTGSSSFLYYATVKKCSEVSIFWHFFSAALGTAASSSILFYLNSDFVVSHCEESLRFVALVSALLWAMSAMLTLFTVGMTMPSIVYISRFWTILLCYILEVLFLPTEVTWTMLTGSAFVIVALILQMRTMSNTR